MSKTQHGAGSMMCDLFAFCTACDPTGADGLVVYGFDEFGGMACPDCNKVMTSYGVNYFDILLHGTNCSECVAAAGDSRRAEGEVILTTEQVDNMSDFGQLVNIAEADIAAKAR